MHVPDEEKRFPCPYGCGKGFISKRALESHEMNVHIKSRPYNCRSVLQNTDVCIEVALCGVPIGSDVQLGPGLT